MHQARSTTSSSLAQIALPPGVSPSDLLRLSAMNAANADILQGLLPRGNHATLGNQLPLPQGLAALNQREQRVMEQIHDMPSRVAADVALVARMGASNNQEEKTGES